MAKKLVIVESPAKAKTLAKILGPNYLVKFSLGHVRDLPKKGLGVDPEQDFAPKYVILPEKRKIIQELKEIANSASAIYLATDPDREGEAISWHLVEAAKLYKDKIPIRRVILYEITKEAVDYAFSNSGTINMNLVNAQQARRILDRLVGYKISPFLWRKIRRGLSAGRVQSAAVRLIVEREREIQQFTPTEYWTIEAELAKDEEASFRALVVSCHGDKLTITSKEQADTVVTELKEADYSVSSVSTKETSRQPAPPFITSTLQQEAWRKLHFSAEYTMAIAQQLYEGLPIDKEGPVGLITYMRTDSFHVAASAIAEARDFIGDRYGKEFLPLRPRLFATKRKWAQEAHEAIRPTKITREPLQLKPFLNLNQFRLYELIWKRMVASQMSAALFDSIAVEIEAIPPASKTKYLLKATSSLLKFPGFMLIYTESKDNGSDENLSSPLPKLEPGDKLKLLDLFPEQHFTQPPPHYTEATLIKALEQKGIGRPSTYAPILSTIQEREYVEKKQGKFHPTELGFIITELLSKHFAKIIDLGFTARMEEELDEVARGKKEWVSILRSFYVPFEATLQKAYSQVAQIKLVEATAEICPDCGKPMVVKLGRYGKFLACSNYPECKGSKSFFIKTGVPCPKCDGELVERQKKGKRTFYSCISFPKCQFATSRRPVAKPCPQCGKLLVHYSKVQVKCLECGYEGKLDKIKTER